MKKIIASILLIPTLLFGQGTQIGTNQIKDGAITNAKVNDSAGIVYTKINFTGATPALIGAQNPISVVSPLVLAGNEISLGVVPTSLGGTGLVGGLPEGEIVFGSGSAFMSNPLFYWDETNSRLGVNDGTPNSTLDVNGTGNFTSFVTIANSEASALSALNISNTSTGSNVIRAYSASNAAVPVLIESENFATGLQVNNRIIGTSLALAAVTTDNGSGFDVLTNRVLFTPGADGVLTLSNAAASGFTQLNFGGTTSSFPALKRSTTNLIVRLGDDSANGGLETETLKITLGTPSVGDVWTATDSAGNGEWAPSAAASSGWENTSVAGVVQLDTPTEEVLIASTLQIGDYNALQQNLLHIEQTVATEPADINTFVGSKINLTADYPSTSSNFTFIGNETNLTTGTSFDNTAGVNSTLTAVSGITRYNATGTDTIENVQGGSFQALLTGDDTITYADGLRARAGISGGAGTVTNSRALVARTPSGATGTITNAYGIYIEDQKTAQVTNAYQIYSTGQGPSILRSTAAAVIPLTLKVPDAQSANTFLIENETGTDLFVVNSAGVITTGGYQGTAIGDTYISSAATWNSKQDGDATLTALAAYNTNGLMTQTAANTFTGRTLTGTANEITIADGDGVAGNPTVSLASILNLSSKTVRIPNSTTLPATCTVGDMYMDTDATSGSRWYLCESTDTWVAQGAPALSGLTATRILVATGTTTAGNSLITHDSTTGVTSIAGTGPSLTVTDDNITNTVVNALVLQNTTAATVGVPVQFSPILRFIGAGWKTDATTASHQTEWLAQLKPRERATAPSNALTFLPRRNGTTGTTGFSFCQAENGQTWLTMGTGFDSCTSSGSFTAIGSNSGNVMNFFINTTSMLNMGSNVAILPAASTFGWFSSTLTVTTSTMDTMMTRKAAAIIHHGAADAASPVAQTLGVQGSRSGTDSDVGGANFTIRSGLGTGTGTPSSLIFSVPVGVASGTGVQTQTAALTIKGALSGLQPEVIFNSTSSPLAADACTTGAFTWDANYIYVCTASGAWKRAALTGGY